MEIKCQLDATEFFIADLIACSTCFGTTMPIIWSSRVLYGGCCLWYLVLWFSSCWPGVELRVMCPVCRMLQYPAKNRTVHVSDSFSVRHQESSTVYTAASICPTGYADCLVARSGCSILIPLANNQHNLYDVYLLVLLCIQY